jgi:hypothetical protein
MTVYEYDLKSYLKELVPVARSSAQHFVSKLNFTPTVVLLGADVSFLADKHDELQLWASASLMDNFACLLRIDWFFENDSDAMLFKLAWM